MKDIEIEVANLELKFENLPVKVESELLRNQYSWKDWKMQSIYRQENKEAIKQGKSRLIPSWDEGKNIEIDEDQIWLKKPFKMVIKEWVDKVPMLKFESIGHYLTFMKSVYFEETEITCKVLTSKNPIKLFQEIDKRSEEWSKLENYLCFKGFKVSKMNK